MNFARPATKSVSFYQRLSWSERLSAPWAFRFHICTDVITSWRVTLCVPKERLNRSQPTLESLISVVQAGLNSLPPDLYAGRNSRDLTLYAVLRESY